MKKQSQNTKKIIVTIEIEVDERRIARRYPNFSINHETNRRGTPTMRGLRQFAKRFATEEKSMREFGFASRIIGTTVQSANANK